MIYNDEELMEANEAVKYLAERWGMDSYSLVAFRSLRFRYKIEPALASRTATFWRKSDLDKIPKPDKSKPRGPRKKKKTEDSDEGEAKGPLVMLGGYSLRTSAKRACAVGA
jgi:hypothetical protein